MRVARIFRFAFPILLMIPFSVIATEPPAIDPANMDLRAKPGDDFYQFANGGWLATKPNPPQYSRWGSLPQVVEGNFANLPPNLQGSGALVNKRGTPAGTRRPMVGQVYPRGMKAE